MVEVMSTAGDGAKYEVPLLKMASMLPEKLNAAPRAGVKDAHPCAQMVENCLKQGGYNKIPYADVRTTGVGGMHYETLLALPAILQDTYDHLSPKDKPPMKFFVGMLIQYVDNNQLKTISQLFDGDKWQQDFLREDFKEFYHSGKDVRSVTNYVAVASPQQDLTLPAVQMRQAIDAIPGTIFNRRRYQFGRFNGMEGAVEGAKYDPDFSLAADRLLPLLVQVYGGSLVINETGRGHSKTIIPQNVFDAMLEGEVPGRSRWEGNAH